MLSSILYSIPKTATISFNIDYPNSPTFEIKFLKNSKLEMRKVKKEDLGLLLLMQQNDPKDEVSEEEIFKILDE